MKPPMTGWLRQIVQNLGRRRHTLRSTWIWTEKTTLLCVHQWRCFMTFTTTMAFAEAVLALHRNETLTLTFDLGAFPAEEKLWYVKKSDRLIEGTVLNRRARAHGRKTYYQGQAPGYQRHDSFKSRRNSKRICHCKMLAAILHGTPGVCHQEV